MNKSVADFLNLVIELGILDAAILNDAIAVASFGLLMELPIPEDAEQTGGAAMACRALYEVYKTNGADACRMVCMMARLSQMAEMSAKA